MQYLLVLLEIKQQGKERTNLCMYVHVQKLMVLTFLVHCDLFKVKIHSSRKENMSLLEGCGTSIPAQAHSMSSI